MKSAYISASATEENAAAIHEQRQNAGNKKTFMRWIFIGALMLILLLLLSAMPSTQVNAQTKLPLTSVVKIIAGSAQSGSGIAIDLDNHYILTNAHVVTKDSSYSGFSRYEICTINDATEKADCPFLAQLIYADIDKDLAILKISGTATGYEESDYPHPAVNVRNYTTPEIGLKINVLGFPGLGGDTITVSQGIVSGFDKKEAKLTAIKTDSELIHGTSGGLAVDENGTFIGIPSSYLTNYADEKIGIIIPANEVEQWVMDAYLEIKAKDFHAPKIKTSRLGQVENLTAKKLSDTSVKLTWKVPISNEKIDHYAITYDTQELFQKTVDSVEQQPNFTKTENNETSFIVQNLQPKKTYYFSVIGVDVKENHPPAWAAAATINLASGEVGDRLFSDVEREHPNTYAMRYLKDNWIMTGYPDGTFRPEGTLKRAELMKIIVLGQNISIEPQSYNNCFSDVKDEWFAQYVCYAKEKNWVNGYSDNTFQPGREINLAEAMKIIEKAYSMPFEKVSARDNMPARLQNQWFTPFILLAHEFNILPQSLEKVQPDEKISRASTAELLYRTILLWNDRDKYTGEVWKDKKGNSIDAARYYGLRDGIKLKYTITAEEGLPVIKAVSFQSGCKKTKKQNCFTKKDKYGFREMEWSPESVRLLYEESKDYSQPVEYDEPTDIFANKNIFKYERSKRGTEFTLFERIKIKMFDGIHATSFLGHETVQTPLGAKEGIKIKETGRSRIEMKVGDVTRSGTMEYEQIFSLVQDMGIVQEKITMKFQHENGEEIFTIKLNKNLTEIKQGS